MIGPFDVNRHKFLTKRKKLKFGLEICLVLRVLRHVLITRKDFLRQIKVDPGLSREFPVLKINFYFSYIL